MSGFAPPRGTTWLYDGRVRSATHPAYRPPARFEHGAPQVVGFFAPTGEEGVEALVSETRMPAAFFTVDVLSRGAAPGYTLAFGSDRGDLAFAVAEALATGMLTITALAREEVVDGTALCAESR